MGTDGSLCCLACFWPPAIGVQEWRGPPANKHTCAFTHVHAVTYMPAQKHRAQTPTRYIAHWPPPPRTPTANVRARSICGARVYGTNQISQTSLGWGSSAASVIVPRRRHVLVFTHASAKYNRSRIQITDLSSVTWAAINHSSSRISPASLISQRFHKFWERLKKYSGWAEQRSKGQTDISFQNIVLSSKYIIMNEYSIF